MDTNIGSVIGTIIVAAFGAIIAFVVPWMIKREDAERGAGDLPIGTWLRVLGSVVMIVGAIQLVLIIVL